MPHRRLPIAIAVFLALTAWAKTASACSCRASGPPCQAFWQTSAVFDATVVSITPSGTAVPGDASMLLRNKIVKLEVHQSWKGANAGTLEVWTNGEGGACGYPFRVGKRYLVFASDRTEGGRLVVSLCSATREFTGTGPDAAFLASLDQPASGGRVYGTVRTHVTSFDQARSQEPTPTETVVHLSGGGAERTARSVAGQYQFSGLSEGLYQVSIDPPTGHDAYSRVREITIANPRACAEENFMLAPAGRVIGRLLDANGRSPRFIRVELTTADATPHPVYGLPLRVTTSDEGGGFELNGLPPGRYIVGVNLADLPNQYNPYPRIVYPGGGQEPMILTLALGQMIDLGTWQLPPPVETIRITGTVVWSDGGPARGVYVGVSDQTGNPIGNARGAGGTTTDADGRFTLEVRKGRIYTFVARGRDSRFVPLIDPPRLDTGGQVPEGVRLVIRAAPQ